MGANVVRLFDPKDERALRAAQPRAAPFNQAWAALPDTMRKRSEGQDSPNLRKAWKLAAFQAGGEERLLAALLRYLREDKDLVRTGGCGLGKWLRDCRWQHWLPLTGVAAAPAQQLKAPKGYRERFVQLLGEEFVRSWIDQCEWRDGCLWAPRQFTVDKLRQRFSAEGIKVEVRGP